MSHGTSIFYSYHEQGTPEVIAGIYVSHDLSEAEMRTKLLTLLDKTEFHERETIKFFNHKKVLAQYWLDNNTLDKDTTYLFSKFFPEALNPENLPVSNFKFVYQDAKANEFIWRNRKHKDVNNFVHDLLQQNLIKKSDYKRGT